MNKKSETIQKQFFDSISEQYLDHYNDPDSIYYRKKYIYDPMIRGMNVDDKVVLDAMCGSGQISEFLYPLQCTLHGLDLSEKQTALYKKRFPLAHVHAHSIVKTPFPDNYFDLIFLFGGLHHVHPHVKTVVAEIFRIVKPGGYFIFGEPHACSIVDKARQVWYKTDGFFMENEAAIDYVRLTRDFSCYFDVVGTEYFGNFAYYLIYNSLILRVPLSVKKIISPLFFFVESRIQPFQTHFFSSYVIAQWRKKI